MSVISKEPGFDSTRALLADPYRFIGKHCRDHGSALFRTRILLRRTICMSGPQAAQLFYDPQRFARRGAAPEPVRATLFGKGGVQGLDGEAHRSRKRMFLDLLAPEQARGRTRDRASLAPERRRGEHRMRGFIEDVRAGRPTRDARSRWHEP